jgi:tetratricopeptide (TPR) repeat protein/class 3 adenylate cyclase/TolB-like protein
MPLLTMMFTDVVGSSATKRDVALGRDNRERDRAYLDQIQTLHFELVRESCRAHSGQEVSTMGDAFFLSFDDPVLAVRCAVDIQRRLAANPIKTPFGPLRVRIGLHSGFPEHFEGSYHGTDVDTAARVEAAASPEQILLSARTYELVRQMTDAQFHPMGQFALKGVDRMSLWEVAWDSRGPRPAAAPSLDSILRKKRILRVSSITAAALVVLGLSGFVYWRVKSNKPIWPSTTRRSVAVLSFENLGKPDVSWLSNALTELLTTELSSNDSIRTISADEVAHARTDLALGLAPPLNPPVLSNLRRILHSEYIVTGSYLAYGNAPSDAIAIDIHIKDAESGESLPGFHVDGMISTLPATLRGAAVQLRRILRVKERSPVQDSQAISALPKNPQAARLYSEGRERLQHFDLNDAREKLEGAIKLEDDCAVVHLALAQTYSLLGYDRKAINQAKLAVDNSTGLSPELQRTIEAQYFELLPDWGQAIRKYTALMGLYVDNPDYVLDLARVQTSAGKGQEALATVAQLADSQNMRSDPRLDLAIALAEESLNEPLKQRAAASSAAQKAERQGSALLAAHAYWQVCSANYNLGDFAAGEQACKQSSNSAPFDDVIKARSQSVWASIYEALGRTPDALKLRQDALETARKVGSQKDVAGALRNLAYLLDTQGSTKEAQAYFAQAVAISREIDSKSSLVGANIDLAGHLYQEGDFAAAEKIYKDTFDIAREIGDKGGMAFCLENIGNQQLQQGKPADAQQSLEQALNLRQEASLELDRTSTLNLLGDALFARGQVDKARSSYEQALTLATHQNSPALVASSNVGLASVKLYEGASADAEKLARAAADTFANQSKVDNEADARTVLAQALLEQGNSAEARNQLDLALKLSPRDQPIRFSLLVANALCNSQTGKSKEAQSELAEALQKTEKLRLVKSSLQIRLALAQLDSAANPKLAAQRLQSFETDASSKGYVLLASEARRKRESLAR